MVRGRALLLVLVATLLSCSSSDGGDDDDAAASSKYAGVDRWKCAEGTSGTDSKLQCNCVGLEPKQDVTFVFGSPVDRCTLPDCFAYQVQPEGAPGPQWGCSCGPEGFLPSADWTSVEPLPSCPPE